MTTTWGGITLPDPSTWGNAEEYVGSQVRGATGTLISDTIMDERSLTLQWQGITKAQRDAIYALATNYTNQLLLLPYGDTNDVIPIINTYSADMVGGVSAAFDVAVTVRTVT